MKFVGVVYLIINMINGKKYVGQTTCSLKKRFNHHAIANTFIGRAIRKYGKENFHCGVIKYCTNREELNYWEIYFIATLKSKQPFGYNCTDGGDGIVGLKRTPEHNTKISLALTGRTLSPEHRANVSAGRKGMHLSEEHKSNIGAALKGIPKTLEHSFKMSKVQRGNSPFKNLIHELDERQMSYAHLAELLGVPHQNISRKMLGQRDFTERDISRIAEVLNKPVEYLLARDDGLPTTLSHFHKTRYKNLLNEIERSKLNYKKLAKILGFSKQVFSAKMRGQFNFTANDKIRLAEIFGKSEEYLFQTTV